MSRENKRGPVPVVGEHRFQVCSIHYTLEKCYRKMRWRGKTADCFLSIEINEIRVGKEVKNDRLSPH